MPVSVTKSVEASASTHAWIPLNVYEDDSRVSIFYSTGGGDREGSIEYTLDNVLAGVSAVPVTAVTITGSAATYATALSQPMRAVRIRLASGSGSAGSFRVLQSGK